MTLPDLMRQLQGDRSIKAYARDLGVSPSTLDKVYGGRRGPGRALVQALVRRHPEERERILALFLGHKTGL